jgi:hypothetical protein
LLGYPSIAYTDHKNNTFNDLKASDCVLYQLLLLEEYGVTFEYLLGKINVVADALPRLDIYVLKNQDEKCLALLFESEFSSIKFPIHTALIFKEQMKVQGLIEEVYHICTTLCNTLRAMTFYPLRIKYAFLNPQGKAYSPGNMSIYFIQDKLVLNTLSGTP